MNYLYCKDCKFHGQHGEERPECQHEEAEYLEPASMVDGPARTVHYSCSSMRAGVCGQEADLFEPRLKAVS